MIAEGHAVYKLPGRPNDEFLVAAVHDLRVVLAHEHAHRVVAQFFGGFVRVSIDPRLAAPGERHFRGQATLYGSLSARGRRCVGLAGSMAEVLLTDPGYEYIDVEEREFLVPLSSTDARMAAGYTQRDLDRTTNVLHARWPEVLRYVDSVDDRHRLVLELIDDTCREYEAPAPLARPA